jgi:hypothetical protein
MRSRVFLLAFCVLGAAAFGYGAARFELIDRLAAGKAVASASAPLFVPQGHYGPQKVVYHVTEKGSWRDRDSEGFRLASVITNHIRAIEPDDVTIEVLFHGNGIDLLKRAKANPVLAAQFDNLIKAGVKFRVCANTLSAYGLDIASLYRISEQNLVQAAVAEIVRLQKDGYGYIRF